MNRIQEIMCYYIALLRSIALVHQQHHWVCKGSNFYGSHLLFERIYKSAAEDSDLASEKLIGLFGTEVLDLHMQAQMIGKTLESFSSGDPIGTSLEVEKKFLDFSEKFYRILKQEDEMSLGLDDMIMSISSNREGAVYLLKQVQGHDVEETGDHMNARMAARMSALKKIKIAEQTERSATIQKKLYDSLNANLASRGWGAVGFRNMYVDDQNGSITVHYDIVLPENAPPYKNKAKYPQGINQFKQEMVNLVSAFAKQFGVSQLAQVMTVNGQ
jgi:DNA-binding ferritin-like protein